MALFIPITKVDVAQRLVYGTLTEEVPDKSGEILDYETARPAFEEWSGQFREASGGKSLGNVRAMHGAVAAGKFTDIDFDDDNKRVTGVAKIVDDEEWQKVLEGVYTGFSIGGGYARRWPDPENPALMRYTPVLTEVSLVDNPAVPSAMFSVIKQDGSTEFRKFTRKQETTDMKDTPVKEEAASPIEALRQGLLWLAGEIKNDNDTDIEGHIEALQNYLSQDEEEDEGQGASSEEEDDDDTSSHAYAAELARIRQRSEARSEKKAFAEKFAELSATVGALQKRLGALETQSLPARGALRATSKEADRSGGHEKPGDALARLTPEERARELMKIALANPLGM